MKRTLEINDIAKEFVSVLPYMENSFVEKIPNKVLLYLTDLAKNSNITVNINKKKSLEEQELAEETKDLISLIYYNYIADNTERKEILEAWTKNEMKYQAKLNEKYHNDVFVKESRKKILDTNLPIKVEKEKIWQKIIKKIIKWIKNKKNIKFIREEKNKTDLQNKL